MLRRLAVSENLQRNPYIIQKIIIIFLEESIDNKLDDLEQMIDSKDSKAIRDRVGTLAPHLLRALSIAQTSHDRSKDAIFVVKMKEQTDQLRSGWFSFLSIA